MVTYGDQQEPGIITDLTSSAAVPTSGAAPSDVGLIGQADLANATEPADIGTVYQITRASRAVELFGPTDTSLLTVGIIDALNEGAYPVYAVAAESTTVAGEDQSGAGSTTVELDNAPLREDAESISVNLDGNDQTPTVVFDNVGNYEPEAGECYVNPVRGMVEINTVPSSSLEFGYDHFDYEGAIDTLVDVAADVVDFVVPLSENRNVVDYANTTVNRIAGEYNLAMATGGAEIYIDMDGTVEYSQTYDDSRTQVVYPTRFEDNTSAIAAYAGFKSSLGLTETPINKRLQTNKRLAIGLNRAERGSLNDEDVVPLADESRGVRITDDPTTVSDSNTDEQNLQYGFNRMVADYIIQTTRDNEKPFIGKLNSETVRNVLEGMIDESLTQLQDSNAVISYTVNIHKENAVTAGLEMNVDLVEPLRFIENTITVGNGG